MRRSGERARVRGRAAGLVGVCWLVCGASPARIIEPNTGVSFNSTRQWGSYRQVAVGLAVKKKVFFKVYAACFYIDKKGGSRELLRLARRSDAYRNGKLDKQTLLERDRLYDWLIDSDLAMTIDLTFVRSFGYERFREKYKERLGLYLDDHKLIDRFLRLPSAEIQAFGHLTFNLLPEGQVVLQYMGKTFQPIRSRPLKRAVLGTFFGRRSSQDRIRRGLVNDIDRLLH